MPFCQQISLAHSHNILKWHPGSRRRAAGSTKQKPLKNSLTVYENKILTYFRGINCRNVSIHGCNCCKTGVDFTKGFKTWHKFSTEIRFMLIPIIVLFIAHEFITGIF